MLSPRLDPDEAWLVVGVEAAAIYGGALWFFVAARRLAVRLPFFEESARVSEAVLFEFRRIGLPLLGPRLLPLLDVRVRRALGLPPRRGVQGLEAEPCFADFFYYAVSTAFTSPPEGISAGSRGARSATMIELLTAIALLGAYVSSFVDWGRRGTSEAN